MPLPWVVPLYVGRVFLVSTLAVLGGLLAIVGLFDVIELTRRAAGRTEVPFARLAEITALKLPFLAIEILPFAVLVGGLLAFWRLSRSSELVVVRAAGLSAWQVLALPVLAALSLGVVAITVVSPVSAALFARADRLDATLLRGGTSALGLADSGLWLKQRDGAIVAEGSAVVHGARVRASGDRLMLERVSVFRLGPDDRPVGRIEAERAVLEPGRWRLENAAPLAGDRFLAPVPTLFLATDVTLERLQKGLAPPDTISFWDLPGFARLLEEAGFPAQRHRLRYNMLLALPLLVATMTLVAAGFAMRPVRFGGAATLAAAGVGVGFSLFVLTKVVSEFGIGGAVPVAVAAWTPTVVGLMFAVSLLLHLEDG